jgi:hypothetical protein
VDCSIGEIKTMMDKSLIEYHFGIILLYATGYDGKISDEELDNIIVFLSNLLRGMGRENSGLDYLSTLIDETKVLSPEKLFEQVKESVEILKQNLEERYLLQTFESIQQIMGDHTLSAKEINFLEALRNSWELSET